jgi:hypothetical protein
MSMLQSYPFADVRRNAHSAIAKRTSIGETSLPGSPVGTGNSNYARVVLSGRPYRLADQSKSPAFDRAFGGENEQQWSKFLRQIAVDLKTDADFDERRSGPSHVHPPWLY